MPPPPALREVKTREFRAAFPIRGGMGVALFSKVQRGDDEDLLNAAGSGSGRSDEVPWPSRNQRRDGRRGDACRDGSGQAADYQEEQRSRCSGENLSGVGDPSKPCRCDATDETEHDQPDCGSHENPPDQHIAIPMPSCRATERLHRELREISSFVIIPRRCTDGPGRIEESFYPGNSYHVTLRHEWADAPGFPMTSFGREPISAASS